MSFILVPIDFSYTTLWRLSIVTFALGRTAFFIAHSLFHDFISTCNKRHTYNTSCYRRQTDRQMQAYFWNVCLAQLDRSCTADTASCPTNILICLCFWETIQKCGLISAQEAQQRFFFEKQILMFVSLRGFPKKPRRLRARLFYLQYSVCGEKRLLSFQTNQLLFWSTKMHQHYSELDVQVQNLMLYPLM